MDTPEAQIRRTMTRVPGSALQDDFLEIKGMEPKPLDAHIQDPGATRWSYQGPIQKQRSKRSKPRAVRL